MTLPRLSKPGVAVVLAVVTALAAMMFTALAPRALALPNPPGQTQLIITEVTVGVPDTGQLRIVGRNLDNGPNLEVTLGEFSAPLVVLSATATEVIAVLPEPLSDGDYLLVVTTGNGISRADVYDLTVKSGLPAGAIILWDQSAECPDGYSRVTAYDGRFLVSAAVPGNTGGSNTHSHTAGTLTMSDHRHVLEHWDGHQQPVDDNGAGTDFNTITGPALGGTVTGTSDQADNRPEFVTILLCRKL